MSGASKELQSNRIVLMGPLADPPPLDIYPEQDRIIAVDGGLDVCEALGLSPILAIGDWDSLKDQSLLKKTEHQTLEQIKNRSDLFFALEAAVRQPGVQEIVCVGVTGGRPDHHLGVLFELGEFASKHPALKCEAVDQTATYTWISPKANPFELLLPKDRLFSLFAVGWAAHGLTVTGSGYELDSAELFPGSLGLSNVSLGKKITITIKAGVVLLVVPTEGQEF